MRYTHRHADGGLYSYQGPQAGKDESTGEWIDGVCYISAEDGKPRWTSKKRWNERFTELPEAEVLHVQIEHRENVETGEVVEYSFRLEETGDVRHMLISASTVAGKSRDFFVEQVLKAQADMVIKGLHVRNLDDVPDFMGDIERFHQNFGLEYNGKPRMLPQGLFDFRHKFHVEETTEYADEQPKLADAVKRSDDRDITNSLELQLDALVDSVYVILGTAYLQFGAKIFNKAWARVQAANMLKVRAEADSDARSHRDTKFDVVKPDGSVAPDHRDLVADHDHKVYVKPGQLNPGAGSDTQVVPTAQ